MDVITYNEYVFEIEDIKNKLNILCPNNVIEAKERLALIARLNQIIIEINNDKPRLTIIDGGAGH